MIPHHTVISSLLAATAALAVAAPSAQEPPASKNRLAVNPELDSFNVAETLYKQGYVTGQTEDMQRRMLERAQKLLGDFAEKYPESGMRTQALYMQATCLSTLKKEAEKMRVLQQLAVAKPTAEMDEYVATAAYIVATTELAAAQKGGATQKKLESIVKHFETVELRTAKEVYRCDAMYRRARALTLLGQLVQGDKRAKAYEQAATVYRSLSAAGKAVPESISAVLPYTFGQLLVAQGGEPNQKEALAQFKSFIESKKGDDSVRSMAVLQAARLASKLNDSDDAAKYYGMLKDFKNMQGYSAEAGLEIISTYYRAGKLKDIHDKYKPDSNPAEFLNAIENKQQRAACAAILGQVYMQNNATEAAADMFLLSESTVRGTAQGADSGYRYVLCQNELSKVSRGDVGSAAQEYLETYAGLTDEKSLNLVNLVRALHADHLLAVSAEQALPIYEALDTGKLTDSSIATEVEYKRIWCMFRVWSAAPTQELADSLEKYFVAFKEERKDAPQLPEVLCLHGKYCYAKGDRAAAIAACEVVIEKYKTSAVYPHCLQLAARACMPEQKGTTGWQDNGSYKPEYANKALAYYTQLLELAQAEAKAPNGKNKDVPIINSYAQAEAQFNLGCLYFNKDVAKAIKMFEAAAESNQKFEVEVKYCLIQCYCKQGAEGKTNLLTSIRAFKDEHPQDYAKLPKDIPAHCAALWYNDAPNSEANCKLAVEYYNDALKRCKQVTYTTLDGQQAKRPEADAREWYKLAKACLEAGSYTSTDDSIGGLDAINHYLSLEPDTQRKAVGMGMKAGMLIGLQRYEEALALCDEASNLGVSGPTLSRLRLISGDAAYLMNQYDLAAERYAVVANFDRENDMQRESCYKLACALRKSGKDAEAEKYEAMLKAKMKAMDMQENADPLGGLPPSVTRHIKP